MKQKIGSRSLKTACLQKSKLLISPTLTARLNDAVKLAWKAFDVDRFIMVVNCLLWFFIKIKDAYNCQPKKVKCRINVFDVQIKLVRPGRAGVVRSAGGAREAVLLVAGFFQLVAWVCLFKWHSEFPSNAKFSCTISSSSWPPHSAWSGLKIENNHGPVYILGPSGARGWRRPAKEADTRNKRPKGMVAHERESTGPWLEVMDRNVFNLLIFYKKIKR